MATIEEKYKAALAENKKLKKENDELRWKNQQLFDTMKRIRSEERTELKRAILDLLGV